MTSSLYICYFGLREPLVQTQVLPYLREVRKAGVEFVLLTFERAGQDESQFDRLRGELADEGIEWHWRRYHKRLSVLATVYDIVIGTLFVAKLLRRRSINIMHGRTLVPTLMGCLGRRLSGKSTKLLFDIRGFYAEEYTDAGLWPKDGFVYRVVKRIERTVMNCSDGFVVLTERAQQILFEGSEKVRPMFDRGDRPVEVIPCCVDLSRFDGLTEQLRIETRESLGASNARIVVYVGSFGGWYMTSEMGDFFATALVQDPSTFALILTKSDHESIRLMLLRVGYSESQFKILVVDPIDVPRYLNASDIAVSFIRASYSKQASSPTKIAEYLACGVPVAINPGVGDLDKLIETNNAGCITEEFNESSYLRALTKLDEMRNDAKTRERFRQLASEQFGMETVGGPRYRRIYRDLIELQ